MEQQVHTPDGYDYRQYDRIWQRVAPDLEPYPGLRQSEDGTAPAPAEAMPAAVPSAPAASAALARQEAQLPGAEMNPGCMGTAAGEMLEVLVGFIEDELADRR